MALPFHTTVRLDGYTDNDTIHTVNLGTAADASAVTQLDVGMAITLDPSGPNKFKPAGDADPVEAYLVQVEARPGGTLAAVAFRFIQRFFLLNADAAVVGDPVYGSTGGSQGVNGAGRGGWVKKDVSANAALNRLRVLEKGTDSATGFTYVVVSRQ